MVNVQDAIEIARAWVAARRDGVPGYRGAFVAGSVAGLADDAVMPAGSDVDVMVVGDEAGYLGKALAAGIVVEGTVLPAETVLDAEAVLRDYHLAPGVAHARILDDPGGEIARVRAAVRARYGDPDTIAARLDHVEARARETLVSATADRTEAERITAWQFGVGQLAHMILVAALENPTIRKRYVLASGVLARFDHDIAYERLLRLARFNRVRPPAVEAALRDLDELLVRAGPVADASDWRFASDVSTPMRPVIMAGLREMIVQGWHRETLFWIAATWCRCARLLEGDGTEVMQPLRKMLRVETGEALDAAIAEARDAVGEFRLLADTIANRTRRG